MRLTRGAEDYLNADYVRWEPGTENYSARGGVDGLLEKKILKPTRRAAAAINLGLRRAPL